MRHPDFELVKEVPLRMQGNDMDISEKSSTIVLSPIAPPQLLTPIYLNSMWSIS
jgi:hypothetical protein